MTFTANVERWRSTVADIVNTLVTGVVARKSLIDQLGLTISGVEDIVLAIIKKESAGNPWSLGDPIAGVPWKPVSYWTSITANAELEKYRSIGLMMLNYDAGTPQGMGFLGAKSKLLDPHENIFYGTKYFLYQLNRYKNVDQAVLAYNAGSVRYNADGSLINLPYLNDVLTFLGEKKKQLSRASFSQPARGSSTKA